MAKNIATWAVFEPSAERKLWTTVEMEPMFRDYCGLPVMAAVHACRFPAMRADVARLALLHAFGGFWADLKVIPLRPFLCEFLKSDVPIFAERPPRKNQLIPVNTLCNGFMGAPPKDQTVLRCLETVVRRIQCRDQSGGVWGISGPGMLMQTLRSMPEAHYQVLRSGDLWDHLIRHTPGSYNKRVGHWSQRQQSESLYLELGDAQADR